MVDDARLVERNAQERLARTCVEQGRAESPIVGDAEWWRWTRKFVPPGRTPAVAATERCGLVCVASETHCETFTKLAGVLLAEAKEAPYSA